MRSWVWTTAFFRFICGSGAKKLDWPRETEASWFRVQTRVRAALRMKFLRCSRLLCYLGGVATLVVLSYYSDGYAPFNNLSFSARVYQVVAASDKSFPRESVSISEHKWTAVTLLYWCRLNPVLQKAVTHCDKLARENHLDVDNQQQSTLLHWKIYLFLWRQLRSIMKAEYMFLKWLGFS